ncbi:hypothetical protein MHU86_1778 [Fragilaria crotonensis]|nr:hypothetical protein MHU86_1778 [Fragilaria crotonensis]
MTLPARICSLGLSRRSALKNSGAAVVVAMAGGGGWIAPTPSGATTKPDVPFQSFQIIPDASASLNPTLRNVKNDNLIDILSKKSGALWLGEHHNSVKDHALQSKLIRELYARRNKSSSQQQQKPMAIGLEQVQIKFQSVLDDYNAGIISLQEMKDGVEWETRWQWPFEGYSPVFETAKALGIPLIALNVNSEDLALVENGGLPSLSQAQLDQYIPDRQGFAEFAKPLQYRVYVDYVIRPSYEMHNAMGLLEYSMSGQKLDQKMGFRNFFSARILWDESMASRAYEWTKSNPGGLLVGLVGADHVKFRNGIPGRYARFGAECTSVVLNPSLIDTRPSGSVDILVNDSVRPDQITLQLRYVKDGVDMETVERYLPSSTGGVMPLADYLLLN